MAPESFANVRSGKSLEPTAPKLRSAAPSFLFDFFALALSGRTAEGEGGGANKEGGSETDAEARAEVDAEGRTDTKVDAALLAGEDADG